MSKTTIPSAEAMADLAARNKEEYEKSVMEGEFFREIIQRIETAAIEGRTEIKVVLQDREQQQAWRVISEHLIQAGYHYSTDKSSFPFKLIPVIKISWESIRKP